MCRSVFGNGAPLSSDVTNDFVSQPLAIDSRLAVWTRRWRRAHSPSGIMRLQQQLLIPSKLDRVAAGDANLLHRRADYRREAKPRSPAQLTNRRHNWLIREAA
jgi:hypothetical protein